MREIILCCILLLSTSAFANDCYDMAGKDYIIDPDLLRAISWVESNYKVGVVGKNPLTGNGLSLMQIDSQHFPYLNQFGITPESLQTDACMNIYTGAYILAIAVNRWGMTWKAVGAYNAGFANTELQEQRRTIYAKKVYSALKAIKARKSDSDSQKLPFQKR